MQLTSVLPIGFAVLDIVLAQIPNTEDLGKCTQKCITDVVSSGNCSPTNPECFCEGKALQTVSCCMDECPEEEREAAFRLAGAMCQSELPRGGTCPPKDEKDKKEDGDDKKDKEEDGDDEKNKKEDGDDAKNKKEDGDDEKNKEEDGDDEDEKDVGVGAAANTTESGKSNGTESDDDDDDDDGGSLGTPSRSVSAGLVSLGLVVAGAVAFF